MNSSPKAMSAQGSPATPLPWAGSASASGVCFIVNATGKKTVANSIAEPEDAAYIVAACNAHPALVESLAHLVQWIEEQEDPSLMGCKLNEARKLLKSIAG